MTGLLTRLNGAFYCGDVAFECVEAVLGCYHFVALRLKSGITLLKHEPSAQIPWQNTMLFFVFVITVSLRQKRQSNQAEWGGLTKCGRVIARKIIKRSGAVPVASPRAHYAVAAAAPCAACLISAATAFGCDT
jgi:hypothetical protein